MCLGPILSFSRASSQASDLYAEPLPDRACSTARPRSANRATGRCSTPIAVVSGPVDVGEPVDQAVHQGRVHGRGPDPKSVGDLDRLKPVTPPQPDDPQDHLPASLGRARMRPRVAVNHAATTAAVRSLSRTTRDSVRRRGSGPSACSARTGMRRRASLRRSHAPPTLSCLEWLGSPWSQGGMPLDRPSGWRRRRSRTGLGHW